MAKQKVLSAPCCMCCYCGSAVDAVFPPHRGRERERKRERNKAREREREGGRGRGRGGGGGEGWRVRYSDPGEKEFKTEMK